MKVFYSIHQERLIDICPRFLMSYSKLKGSKKEYGKEWMMDSGGFTLKVREENTHISPDKMLDYEWTKDEYANFILSTDVEVAWTMDYAIRGSESEEIKKKKMEKTVENASFLIDRVGRERLGIIIQGMTAERYLSHLDLYRERGIEAKYIGIGGLGLLSLPKFNIQGVEAIEAVAKHTSSNIHLLGVAPSYLTVNPSLLSHVYSTDTATWSRFTFGLYHQSKLLPGLLNEFVVKTEKQMDELNGSNRLKHFSPPPLEDVTQRPTLEFE